MNELNTIFEVNGICYIILTENTVTVIGRTLEYSCDIIIPESVTCNNVKYSVTEIGRCAFSCCSRLTSIIIPDSVTEIGEEAFFDCSELTSIRIPDSVTKIGCGAFFGCSGLTSVHIPDPIIEISDGAFLGCSGLTSVTIPDSVTEIGRGAFCECSRLTSIRIPDSVTEIECSAFLGCSGLKSIYIGANVSRLGNDVFSYAFKGCKLIEDIAIAAVVPPAADENNFYESVYAQATLRVPEAAIETYKTTEPWSKFATIKPLVKQ